MSEMRVADPSKLHLKKELIQIRMAARNLKDPGTVSSWKSPLSSARSAAAIASSFEKKWVAVEDENDDDDDNTSTIGNATRMESRTRARLVSEKSTGGKEKRVFLYNWRNHKSSSERSGMGRSRTDGEERGYESESVQESFDDSLSDARNAGDMRRDHYMVEPRSASRIFRCRDTSLIASAVRRTNGFRRKSKKSCNRLDVLSRYQQKEKKLRNLLKSHPLGFRKDGSLEQSDETEEFSNSEDLRKTSRLIKNSNWPSSSTRLLESNRGREESSFSYSTPALSACSYNRYLDQRPSTAGSWDATTVSYADNYDGLEGDDHLDFPSYQGCGIPCYWSRRTPRYKDVSGSCCSPSISDCLRKRSSVLRGRKSGKHHHRSVSASTRYASKSAQGLVPLLSNGDDGITGSSLGTTDDELSTNFGEIDLEALSRLDGRRWSSCRSQDELETVTMSRDCEEERSSDHIRSLSQKYRPFFFADVIGQSIIVQSLLNAISRGKVSPVYLFQGPRGTGKTSTARIFATALNCRSKEAPKPCGFCRECVNAISGNTKYIWEVDGTVKKEIENIKRLFKMVTKESTSNTSQTTVFIIDECHLLTSRMWLTLLKLFENPMPQVIFIFITTDIDNVPRTVQSRCHKYLFNKIKELDIVARLEKIAAEENWEVELEALELIALSSDGSLRDAETMLDQLSLLGKRITTTLVNDFLGVVADEKLLELLESAMSSDTSDTVKRARDLLESGVDPLVLMSQMAGLIMDIIAGLHTASRVSAMGERILSENEVEKLKHALKVLSEAEKQLRVSNDRATWFTATLLQLSSGTSLEVSHTSSSRRLSSRSTEDDHSSTSREAIGHQKRFDFQQYLQRSTSPTVLHKGFTGNPTHSKAAAQFDMALGHSASLSIENGNPTNMHDFGDIWEKCIDSCHSQTLRQLLRTHGKLISVSKSKGALVAYVAFDNEEVRARAERFLSSITNSIEVILRQNVEVRIVCLSEGKHSTSNIVPIDLREGKKVVPADRRADALVCSTSSKLPDGSTKSAPFGGISSAERNREDINKEVPIQRIESIIREQNLETAWLQAAEKGASEPVNSLPAEKDQMLLPADVLSGNLMKSLTPERMPLKQQDTATSHNEDSSGLLENQNGKQLQVHNISPSLLHSASFVVNSNNEYIGYESKAGRGGCNGFWCWNRRKSWKKKVRTPVHPSRRKSGRFLLFGKCRRPNRGWNKTC